MRHLGEFYFSDNALVCSCFLLSRIWFMFLVKVVFDEVEVQSSWSSICCLWYYLSNVNAKVLFWPQFQGKLNIEVDSESRASMNDGQILVSSHFDIISFKLKNIWYQCPSIQQQSPKMTYAVIMKIIRPEHIPQDSVFLSYKFCTLVHMNYFSCHSLIRKIVTSKSLISISGRFRGSGG